jgi:competence protein ComEC
VGIVMLPIGAAVLWSGYIKVMAGLIWPTMGEAIGHVTGALADFLAMLVKWAAASPGAAIWVPTPGIGWTVATIALSAAILRGTFRRRPLALAACVIVSATWLLWPTLSQRIERRDDALTINMFNVGDGSCYLLRSGGDTLIYDCGSSNYADITTASIGPALRAMGVMRVGTLVITHPDTDHFSGSLELIEQFHVKRVGLTDFFQAQAKRPWSAPGLLVSTLRQRGVEIVTVSRGWSTKLCDAEIEALWPPAGAVFQRDNDTSIVLSVRAGGRRVMMTGDIQHEAMKGLLTSGVDLRSDVLELPHHGSMIPPAPPFFYAVNPAVVLQSSGRRRLDPDKWAEELAKTERHITTFHGMVTLHVGTDGVMKAEHFLKSTPPEQEED